MWGDPAHRTSIGEVSHHPNLEVLQLANLTLDRVRVQQGLGGGWAEDGLSNHTSFAICQEVASVIPVRWCDTAPQHMVSV